MRTLFFICAIYRYLEEESEIIGQGNRWLRTIGEWNQTRRMALVCLSDKCDIEWEVLDTFRIGY